MIKVIVKSHLLAFSEILEAELITEGQSKSWSLPEIKEEVYPLENIEFEPNSKLATSLTFDKESR